MTIDEALEIVRQKSMGRTRYEGKEPYLDEVLVAEIERLTAVHSHCDHCGGSWLDDGINGGCHCREIERLRAELAAIRRHWQEGIEELNTPWRLRMAELVGDTEGLRASRGRGGREG